MDHGRKEGCEEVRKEGGKEGNNTHGAWKEDGERVGKRRKEHNILSKAGGGKEHDSNLTS